MAAAKKVARKKAGVKKSGGRAAPGKTTAKKTSAPRKPPKAAKGTSKRSAGTSKRASGTSKRAAATETAKPASPAKALSEYRRKRDFSRTSEPSGDESATGAGVTKADTKPLRFVIQKHAASHLHFDFRLELDGVMKSWAVPKGPSVDTSVRRLAMEVEDHPISYNTFEGIIPAGQYGGGTVMLWDRGHYLSADGNVESLRRGMKKGRLDIVMLGERLKGGFTLVRSNRDTGKPQWLLFKRTDEFAEPGVDIVEREVTSIDTGRTMDEIAQGEGVWQSSRRRTRE